MTHINQQMVDGGETKEGTESVETSLLYQNRISQEEREFDSVDFILDVVANPFFFFFFFLGLCCTVAKRKNKL